MITIKYKINKKDEMGIIGKYINYSHSAQNVI